MRLRQEAALFLLGSAATALTCLAIGAISGWL